MSGYNDNFTAIACDESQMKGLLKLMITNMIQGAPNVWKRGMDEETFDFNVDDLTPSMNWRQRLPICSGSIRWRPSIRIRKAIPQATRAVSFLRNMAIGISLDSASAQVSFLSQTI